MCTVKVNINHDNCQAPIHGGSNAFDYICLFFMCKYLHFSEIILNTHTHTHTADSI
jgi:hypothetical protein